MGEAPAHRLVRPPRFRSRCLDVRGASTFAVPRAWGRGAARLALLPGPLASSTLTWVHRGHPRGIADAFRQLTLRELATAISPLWSG